MLLFSVRVRRQWGNQWGGGGQGGQGGGFSETINKESFGPRGATFTQESFRPNGRGGESETINRESFRNGRNGPRETITSEQINFQGK